MRRFLPLQRTLARRLRSAGKAPQVLEGPFAGMRYFSGLVWGPMTPKWAGTYEKEIQPWIQELLANPPVRVVDVGCAEGYYAVGVARALPGVPVHSFDIDRSSRRQLRRLARLNDVQDQIVIRGWCSHETLQNLASDGGFFLIVDIEGGEWSLLDPDLCPVLRHTAMIVELHAWQGQPVQETARELRARFQSSHHITEAQSEPRRPGDSAAISRLGFARDVEEALLNEHRGYAQTWLLLRPISG